jgi:hypothetical protein
MERKVYEQMAKLDGLHVLPPVGYLEMLGLMRDAKLVLTDSGGIQEETTALGVPCLPCARTPSDRSPCRRHQYLVGSSRCDPGRVQCGDDGAARPGAFQNTGMGARRCGLRIR